MLTSYKEKIQRAKNQTLDAQEELLVLEALIPELQTKQDNIERAYTVAKKAAQLTQSQIAEYFTNLVTNALQVVFGGSYEFVVEFVKRRGVIECDLYVTKDGEKRDIFEDEGGGLADVCSFAMQVGYILLSPVNNTLITDEAMRHLALDSHGLFLEIMKKMCDELDFQVILVTHSPVFKRDADCVYVVDNDGENSTVRRTK